MNNIKISVRLKLSDFINTKYESKMIERIKNISDEIRHPFLIYLWYDGKSDNITSTILSQFILRWERNVSTRTVIKPKLNHPMNEFVWFDIVNLSNKHSCGKYRFQYVYNDNDLSDLMKGLSEFFEAAKFCSSPKPTRKKQKRND